MCSSGKGGARAEEIYFCLKNIVGEERSETLNSARMDYQGDMPSGGSCGHKMLAASAPAGGDNSLNKSREEPEER